MTSCCNFTCFYLQSTTMLGAKRLVYAIFLFAYNLLLLAISCNGLAITKHGYGYECQGKAKARRGVALLCKAKAKLFGAKHSNGRALKRNTQYRNGIVTYRGVTRSIGTEPQRTSVE